MSDAAMGGGAKLMEDGNTDPPMEQPPPQGPVVSVRPGEELRDASSEDGVPPETPTTPSEVGSEAPCAATPEGLESEDGIHLEGALGPKVGLDLVSSNRAEGSALIVRRGPGRPRKDGSSPVQRKKIHSSFPGRPRIRSRRPGLLALQAPSNSGQEGSLPDLTTIGSLEQEPEPQLPLAPFPASSSDVGFDAVMALEASTEKLEEYASHERQERVCSFCNLGEGSHLGQGKLLWLEPTPGLSPILRRQSRPRRVSADADVPVGGQGKPSMLRRGKPASAKPIRGKCFTRSSVDSRIPLTAEDTFSAGFSEELDITTLFESTGHTLAHQNCASWSEGVCQAEDGTLLNVDRAVCVGMTQACSGCQKFGATIRCHVPDCYQIFHFPCGAAYGCFQDMKALMLLCPTHANKAPSFVGSRAHCQSCEELGSLADLLLCTQCGAHLHGYCLDPPVLATPSARAGWQCPECKVCQVCSQSGDDSKMMSCDTCDKGFHIYCVKPIVASVPKHGWKCQNCRVCGDCGARTPGSGPSSRWHMNFSVCDSCYQQRNKGVACPLCGKAYRQFTHRGDMTQCTACRKFIHMECDSQLLTARETDYVCPVCNNTRQQANISQSSKIDSSVRLRTPPSDGSPVYMTSPQKDTLAYQNEDSRSSAENDLQQQQFGSMQRSPSDSVGGGECRPPRAHHSVGKPPFARFSGKRRFSVGRSRAAGGKFAAKRRAKAVEFRRKRGPKQKLKSYFLGCNIPQYGAPVVPESKESKQDEEPAMDNKMVLFSASDSFVLSQDLCAMCGSFGLAEEGRLIACAQCGQCYHPYCVSVKVTKMILKKGWRCLDCTVCEGCGKPHDESRLLLCDECDISYHTYCLNPPLDTVPQGNWKCQWCVVCLKCGSADPGYGSQWQNNYTQCGPCASQVVCPICTNQYLENDLVIRCVQCDRWLHGHCDQVFSEEDAEKCAEYGYNCLFCRPKDEPLPHQVIDYTVSPSPPPCESPPPPPAVTAVKVPKEAPELPMKTKPPPPQYILDGVLLSENGLHHIKSLMLEQPKRPRVRRPRVPSGGPLTGAPPTPVSGTFRSRLSTEDSEDAKELLDLDMDTRMEADDEAKLVSEEVPKADAEMELRKKRQRKLHKLGIGGFVAKPRSRGLSAKEHEPLPLGLVGGETGSEAANIPTPAGDGASQLPEGVTEAAAVAAPTGPEKPKRRRRVKRKNPLEDSFPSYLQEAFFGHDLLVTSRTEPTPEMPSDNEEDLRGPQTRAEDNTVVIVALHGVEGKGQAHAELAVVPGSPRMLPHEVELRTENPLLHEKAPSTPAKTASDDEDLGLKDILPHDLPQDDELMDMLMNDSDDLSKQDPGLDDVTMADQGNSAAATGDDESTGGAKDDPLSGNIDTVLLSPHFNLDSMVSASSGLPHMDSKDVEDVFKGVLSPADTCGPSETQMGTLSPLQQQQASTPVTGSSGRPSLQNPLTPVSSHGIGSPFSVPPPSPFPMDYGSPQLSEPPPSPWTDLDTDLPSSGTHKNILKWENDEALGPSATISPVLYANLNCQSLRLEYPNWADRSKQIAKIWRNLPPEKRQPYLQKARDNRTASRIQKSQDPGKVVREQKSPRELEQERQWKQLQHMRQQQQSPRPAQHLLPAEQQPRTNVGKSHQMMIGECPSPAGSLSPSAPSPTSSQIMGASAQVGI